MVCRVALTAELLFPQKNRFWHMRSPRLMLPKTPFKTQPVVEGFRSFMIAVIDRRMRCERPIPKWKKPGQK